MDNETPSGTDFACNQCIHCERRSELISIGLLRTALYCTFWKHFIKNRHDACKRFEFNPIWLRKENEKKEAKEKEINDGKT